MTSTQAPTPLNFQHAVTRAEAEAARLACEEREAAGAAASINARPSPTPSSAAGAALAGGGTLANNNNNNNNNDATFISQVGFPEDRPISSTLSRGGKIPRPGGAGTGRGGGGGGSGGTRGGVTKSAAQRKKEMVLKFAGPIVATLPIQYREQQPYRGDVETVIGALKDHHEGLRGRWCVRRPDLHCFGTRRREQSQSMSPLISLLNYSTSFPQPPLVPSQSPNSSRCTP